MRLMGKKESGKPKKIMPNFKGDKLILNFGKKFQRYFLIAHVKLHVQNCHGNVLHLSVLRWRQSFKML